MRYTFIPLVFIIFFTACTYDTCWEVNTGNVEQPPAGHIMPLKLFQENIRTTSYTALVYITRARVLKKPVWPFNKAAGYVNHEYEAEVIETYRGDEHKKIRFTVMAEADIEAHPSPYRMVVSLCGTAETGYYVPDNGYVSPASDELTDWGEKDKKNRKTGENEKSVCQ